MGVARLQAARFLIAPLDNFKKMFSPLLAGGARAFRNQGSGGGIVAFAGLASRQVSAFWENLVETALLGAPGRVAGTISVSFVSRIARGLHVALRPQTLSFRRIRVSIRVPAADRPMDRFRPQGRNRASRSCPVRDCRRSRYFSRSLIVRRPRVTRGRDGQHRRGKTFFPEVFTSGGLV